MAYSYIHILGRLARDPELRMTKTGYSVLGFSVAVNHPSRQGEEKAVSFFECTMMGKRAETLSKHLAKGDDILIGGDLQLDSWVDRSTQERRTKLKVNVSTFSFVGSSSRKESASAGDEGGRPPQRDPQPRAQQQSFAEDDSDEPPF